MLRATYRRLRFLVGLAAVAAAAAVVSVVTIDLGPALKARAERAASTFIDRPVHIGRLGIHLARGRFIVEDLRIEGLTPASRPWLVADRISVSLTWSALVRREVLLDSIEMTGWTMTVETFPGGVHNWPRLTGPPRPPRTGPRPVVTTLQHVDARRGTFVFEDHAARWGVVAPNLDVTVAKMAGYAGRARFHGGTVRFQGYLPMSAAMTTSFRIDGGRILLDEIGLITDGAVSRLTGVANVARWPEMTYQVRSVVQFPRMREIFFAGESFSLHGEGEFTGTFRVFKGGRELTGTFASREAGINAYRFTNLTGALEWVPERFEVLHAESGFYGGRMRFAYRMADLGRADRQGHARFEVEYDDVDLRQFTDFLDTRGIRLAGRASGRTLLEWTLGRFAERRGSGTIRARPPDGVRPMGRAVTAVHAAEAEARARDQTPFSDHTPLAPVPIEGEIAYAIDGPTVTIPSGYAATEDTFVSFDGTAALSGADAHLAFHVSSASWQESDRLLAGLLTAFGAPTRAIEIDGVGEFDGVMTGAFRRPRIEGRFRGSAMQAFDVIWGEVDGEVVVENGYAEVSDAVVTRGESRIDVSGRFSLGYPRADGGEEIDARVRLARRPVADLLDAFDIEDYRVDGLLSGEVHVYGRYTGPAGFGRLTIEDGIAYDERFSTASGSLRFEGTGVRVDGIELRKGGGIVTGAAYVGWNGTYSFNATARGIAVESLDVATFPDFPRLTGVLGLTARGSGSFEAPRYDVEIGIQDLFVGEEGIGEVSGRLFVRDEVMSFEVEASSPRLAVSGTGRVALGDEHGDAEMMFRVTDTSLDPYLRVVRPDLSPYTTAVASGTIHVLGELYTPDALRVSTVVESIDMRLVDYRLRNQGPIQLSLEGRTLRVETLRLVGEDTALDVTGTVDLERQALSLQAAGAANLAVLQGFFRDVRSSGRADVSALIGGTLDHPVVSGQAVVTQGRLRHFSFPHAIEGLNGTVSFDASGIRLDGPGDTPGLAGRLGGGAVRFGGRIGIADYRVSEFDVTAAGDDMRLRFPEGMRSVVDATLALQGPVQAPTLRGTITAESATWTRGFEASASLFSLGGEDSAGLPSPDGALGSETLPLRYDVRIVAPSALRIQNDEAEIVASADLTLRGTFDRPLLFGRAEIERGDVRFEGRRYQVTRGTLDFTNPARIQPFFDIEAETRVRVPGQTYRVTLRMTGTTDRLQPSFESDPPLPPIDVLTLLFSDTVPTGDAELALLRQPNQREQEILQARATRALTGALSKEVGRVVEETFGVDTFQITPLLIDPYQQSSRLSVNPAARLTIGKRISERVYLTYARSLSSSQLDEIILLEYDQSDRLGWVLSQNEDRTYAIEVRRRHLF